MYNIIFYFILYFIQDGPTCFDPYMRFIFREICFKLLNIIQIIFYVSYIHILTVLMYFNINFSNQDNKYNILNCIT
jgi:hypothetical protein